MLNLQLCNIDHLWIDATAITPAKIISTIDQDYICLLADNAQASSVSLDMSSMTCLESVGLLQINQPRDSTNNIVNISLKADGLNSFNKITCFPRSTVNFNSSASKPIQLSINSLNANKINLSNKIQPKIFEINTISGAQLTDVSGTISSWNNLYDTIFINNSLLNNSTIFSETLLLNNTSLITSKIFIQDSLTINVGQQSRIIDTIISGHIVTYNGNGLSHTFDNEIRSQNRININNCGIILGSIVSDNNNSELKLFMFDVHSIQNIKLTNPQIIYIKTIPKNYLANAPYKNAANINQFLSSSQSITIEGSSAPDPETNGAAILTSNAIINSPTIKISNFINYGSMTGDDIVLNNGINYGTIKGKKINLEEVDNQGVIEQL